MFVSGNFSYFLLQARSCSFLLTSSSGFCCPPCSTSSSKFGGMLLLTLNVTVILQRKMDRSARLSTTSCKQRIIRVLQSYFSPEIVLVSLVSVPFISSSHPPDIFGRLLFFWSFFSSLISSDKKLPNALSPVENGPESV